MAAPVWIVHDMPHNPTNYDVGWIDIAHGNGMWIATSYGINGGVSVATTPDGATWTLRPVPVRGWMYVAFGNDRFVVASRNTATSTDGISWTPGQDLPVTVDDITFGNGRFVAMNEHFAFLSTDGTNWSTHALPDQLTRAGNTWHIAYGNGLFVAVGYVLNGYVAITSPDGVTWTGRTIPPPVDPEVLIYALDHIAFGNGRFVALGFDVNPGAPAVSVVSRDGINWTRTSIPARVNWRSIAFGGGLFLAIGFTDVSRYGIALTSPDGVTWTPTEPTPETPMFTLAFGDGRFVATGHSTVYYGSNAISGLFSAVLAVVDTAQKYYLRMTQRNDGRGVQRHARLRNATQSNTPRLGQSNTYQ